MNITEERKMIQVEETKPNAAVSESVMSRVGAGINFINLRHTFQHDWHINGKYNAISVPKLALDGYITYPFPFQIVDVQMFTGDALGSSGTTELDVKWKPENSGSFVSIFSTTPKVLSTAATFESIREGQTKTGWTAPVLSKTTFDAFDILRLDLLQAQLGNPKGVFLKVYIRPISP